MILSCVNSLILAVSFAIHRDILGRSTTENSSLKSVRLLTIIAGAAGVIMADMSRDIVHLLLNCFYGLLVLGPALLGAALRTRTSPLAGPISIVAGYATTLAALASMPGQAFLPGLIVSAISFYGITGAWARHSKARGKA